MKYIKYTELPSVNDTIGFELETYDKDGVLKNPQSLEKITIYYIEKGVRNDSCLEHKFYKHDMEAGYQEINTRQDVDSKYVAAMQKIMEDTASVFKVYYDTAKIVMSTVSPLWTPGGKKQILIPSKPGKFIFVWKPVGMREGTYVIRWDWKLDGGKRRTGEKIFTLTADLSKLESIYSRLPPREKYNFLMDKYIPKMYRTQTKHADLTPHVLVKLNRAVAQGFLEIEDMAAQLGDLLDPMFAHEYFLPVLANFFNLELRSNNVGAWRNQIKQAPHLYKKKGTIAGLRDALDKSGINLFSLKNLWQVVSPYTWTESFIIDKDINYDKAIIGYLSKNPVSDYVTVFIKSYEEDKYIQLPSNILTLERLHNPEPRMGARWNGDNNEPPLGLFSGDCIKVTYKYNKLPQAEEPLEKYINSLPLADSRDESKIKYPLKNWNVKLIEEDDAFFDMLVPQRHSFSNPVTFGKTRTTFMYSEKVYNMDTFNGSLRNSTTPCDIDKDFVDGCSGGQSSKFNLYVEMNDLSNYRIKELKDIVIDYSPFHAILHKIKINIKIKDIVLPPVENVKNKINSKNSTERVDKVATKEKISCKIKYKDGTVLDGNL